MNIRVNDLRRGWRWSYLVPTMWVVVSFLSAPFSAQAATTSLQPRTVLRITAPKQVKVGQPIQLDLTLVGATAIAGYETHVLFDTTAGHFSGLRQRNNDLKQTGRDVSPLTVSELSDGVAIGFYSCAQADCVTRKGPRQRQGGRGTLKLASLVIDTYREGTLSIVLSSTRFVDQQGGTIAVDIPSPHVAVQIGSPSTPVRLTAPRPRWRLANGVQGTNGPFDLNGDGIVSHADAMEVALAWTAVRERGQPCSTQQYASRDVNHDGCIDVADAQLVATNYSNNTAGGVPAGAYRHNAAPLSLQALGEWTVDTEIDSNDANIGDGVCQANVTSTGKCTLRAAIQEANARQGPDAIGFTIPGSGVRLIQLKSALPALSDLSGPTTIDGYTQAGTSPNTDPIVSNAVIGIEIRGTGATGFDGLPITSSGNIIRGLSFYNLRRSLFLNGSGATNNRIVGNFIGTNAAATFQSPTSVLNANGVDLAQGAANNRIGDVAAADRNVISGNARNGIATYYEYTDANIILNNIVGLHPLGTNRLTNQANGIDINSYSSYNIIGGTDVGQRNVLSGNTMSGMEISHGTLTVKNQVVGNFIGSDVNGTSAGASYTYNTEWGVHVEDGVNNNLVANNVIGNNRLGGVKIEAYNTIANQFANNRIGVGLDGSAMPNSRFGIQAAYHAQRNLIGPGNIIANNPIGVAIDYLDDDYNTITQNSIYNNTSLGIDLGPQIGVSYNDSGDADTGANEGLNYPVLQSATPAQVTGTACAEASVPKPCTVEVFIAEVLPSDQGGGSYGQGKTFVGGGTVSSNGTFAVAVSNVEVDQYVTATVTDATGNTSEFSYNRIVGAATVPSPTPTLALTTVPGPNTYVSDTFDRTVTDGWGSAERGGGWALEAPSRPTVDYDVANGVGTMVSSAAGQWHSAYLPAAPAAHTDMLFRVSKDTTTAGGSEFVYFVARRVENGTQYLGRIGFDAGGNVFLQAAKSYRNNTSLTLLGTQTPVTGITYTADTSLWVRGQVVGTNPTVIRIRVWQDGQAEPAGWMFTTTDGEPVLQTPGAVGLRTYVSPNVTSVPVTYAFDNVLVTEMEPPPPTATPTPSVTNTPVPASPTPTATETPVWTATPMATETELPTATATATETPTNTPTSTNTPTATHTATPTATNPPIASATPTSAGAAHTYVADSFERTTSNGWGSTTPGGTYTLSGTAANFSTNGSVGVMTLPSAGASRAALLTGVNAQHVESLVQLTNDKAPTGGSLISYVVLRRVGNGTEYRARVRYGTDGRVMLLAEKYVNGVQTLLGGERAVSGVTVTGQTTLWLRVQVVGSSPTTLRLKAWSAEGSEPSAWTYTASDSEAALQTGGGVGLAGYLASNASNAPIRFAFDNFQVSAVPTP